MRIFRYKLLLVILSVMVGLSCKDDKQLVPVWESGVNGYAEFTEGSEENFVYGFPAIPVSFDLKWVSTDQKNTVTKIDVFVLFDEPYVDDDGNDKLARHGGSDGLLLKTIEGSAVPANRTNTTVVVTQDDVYQKYKDHNFAYKKDNPIAVFGSTPKNPLRTTSNRFVADDQITIRWELTTADGRVFSIWSPSVCTELPGSNCQLAWTVVDPNDSKPSVTISLKSGKNLKGDAKDTVFFSFNKIVSAAPALSLEATNGGSIVGTITNPVLYKSSKTQYFSVFTAPTGYTGGVKVTASGSSTAGDPPFGGLTMSAKNTVINVDNTSPEGIGNAKINLAKGSTATISIVFNEALSTLAKDSIYVTVTGQNMDPLVEKRMQISSDGKTASIAYKYADADGDATAGALTIVIGGGKDVAGNPINIVTLPQVTVDLFIPTAVTISLASPYDLGTQLKIASASITNAGTTSATVYWIAIADGDTPPIQKYSPQTASPGDAPANGAKFDGFDNRGKSSSYVKASGNFATTTASSGPRYVDFTPNGTFSLYFYAVTSTGNVSAITDTPVQIVMNP